MNFLFLRCIFLCHLIEPSLSEVDLLNKVHQRQNRGLSWNRSMDEVHVERLIQKYKDRGEFVSEDPALVMLKQWPASKQYKDNPEKLPGLEQLVCNYKF